MSHEPLAATVAALALLLAAAKLAGHACVRLGQPPVLGELLVGVALGNLQTLGLASPLDGEAGPSLDVLSRLGALLLLFEVGLASTLRDIAKVGAASTVVAVTGVVAPFALGWTVAALVLPAQTAAVHAFVGATLTATSVGITARVLKDMGRSRSREAQIIIGAAVIDDVLGLLVLAVIGALLTGSASDGGSFAPVLEVIGKAAAFLVGAIAFGLYVSPRVLPLVSRLAGRDVRLVASLVLCFTLAYAASLAGLAAIVGAYAAGLILEDVHFRATSDDPSTSIETLVQPLSAFLTPIFFVVMGLRVQLHWLAHLDVLTLAALLILVAIAGKIVSAAPLLGRGLDTLSIGVGMIPRGEVGLIFANIGVTFVVDGHRLLDERFFAALVAMIVVTTVLTPPLLGWSLRRRKA